jgi:beta-lactamase superfamily II metal-dependent hydrolase
MARQPKPKTSPPTRRPARAGRSRSAADADLAPIALAMTPPRLTVRHYCQGIGDSHLLTFPRPDGTAFRMLIDCGLHPIVKGGTEIVASIANDIKQAIGPNPIDVLVITHEHMDHLSGFLTANDIFKDIVFKELWMPWTEKPGDPLAEELDKHRRQALAALDQVTNRLAGQHGLSKRMTGLRDRLGAMMGFYFGAKGDRLRSARDAAIALVDPKGRSYLEPGGAPLSIPGLPDIRVYVLGPPRDRAMLKLEESKPEMYQLGRRSGWGHERALNASFALSDDVVEPWAEEMAPFADSHGHDLDTVLNGNGDDAIVGFVADHYAGQAKKAPIADDDSHLAEQDWRRIDADWMGIAADLALQLDQGVNNTSLVLAFEFVDTGRVVLFPGDAQIGNWLSWQTVTWKDSDVKSADLLARTVYLKVAHHGSHNATPSRQGLELMTSPDLAAFVPVNEDDAKKAKWKEMPFGTILRTLADKAAGRVIRADDAWLKLATGQAPFPIPSGSLRAVRNEGKGWVEVDIA